MLKVTKFGGSSMADAGQYRKVKDIILSDHSRKVVVVSAAGKCAADIVTHLAAIVHGNLFSVRRVEALAV